jgi:Ecdysteroid kinase-like family
MALAASVRAPCGIVENLLERIRLVAHARSAREGELVQRLWAGYGEIRRVYLSGAQWPSVIVKRIRPPTSPSLEAPSGARAHARKLRSYAVEATWYERYATRCDESCRVALLLWCERASEQPLLVLEDLDAAGYAARHDSLGRGGMRICLDWLAQFHAMFVSDPGDGLWPTGTYWHLDTRPDELAVSRDPALRAAAPELDARLQGARFRSLVHGDAKLANFCFTSGQTAVAAVDFQYVGPGVGVQDVAYFIDCCLDDRASAAHAEELLDHYFRSLRRALSIREPDLDGTALEAEWRALYPTAYADFYRFLSGWAPEHYAPGSYAQHMIALALSGRERGP